MSRRDKAAVVMSEAALDGAAAAIERGDWQQALELLDGLGDSPRALELRAMAAYGEGRFEDCVSAWENMSSACLAAGDEPEAARAAAMLAMFLMMDTGLMAPVRGWIRRAERLLGGRQDTPASALVPMVRTYERLLSGDIEATRANSAESIRLGEQLGVAPAVVIGRVAQARIQILDGSVSEGLEALDEVGALLMSGGADPLTTGMMYCELICAAQSLGLHDLATEWTEVMERWRHGAAFGGINGRCRVHRAEMLRVSGPCDSAEAEALAACEELRPWMRREFGWPLVELGNIRLRKGDLDGAEAAFEAAHNHAWSPQPGLALLRLEQGDPATAAALIAEAIEHPFDVPFKERPPFGDLRLAPLLDAQVAIAAEMGDPDTASRAADALAAVARSYESRALEASASVALGRAALVSGEPGEALAQASRGVAVWVEMGAPFEAAAARMVAADAAETLGNTDLARMERQAALGAFRSFGAHLAAERAAAALGEAPVASTASEATFEAIGDTRTVTFAGSTVRVRDLKGFRYIERLLAEPGREFPALDLVSAEHSSGPPNSAEADLASPGASAGLPVLDETARVAYETRLTEINEDLEEAERFNDPVRAEQAATERDFLVAELSRALGLGGRPRTVGGDVERARTSVTRTIRYGLDRLAQSHASAAAHLGGHLRTGTYCSYVPDPVSPVEWRTGREPDAGR